MKASTRRTMLGIHRWVGLTLGLIVMVSAFTGALMAFRKQLDPLIYPGNFSASICSDRIALDALVARARIVHPGADVDYVRLREGLPVIVRFLDKQSVFIDGCNGAVTGEQNRYAGIFGTLEYIHRGQWLPEGGWLMGSGALSVVFVLAALGIWLWWPRKPRRVVDALKVERRLKGPAFTLGLHRTVGAWGGLLLLFSALTGLPNAFEAIKTAMVGPAAQPPMPALGAHGPAPSLAAQWQSVQEIVPNPRDALIHVARKTPATPIEVFAIEHGASHANARTYVYLDGTDGRILRVAPYLATSFGSKAYYWALSYHTGDALGVLGQLMIFFAALSALTLGYTGIGTWARRTLRKMRTRRTAGRVTVPAE